MIIGLIGTMGSGKDEACRQLIDEGMNIIRMAFADRLKQMVQVAWKISDEDMIAKPQHVRDLLQIVGTNLLREQVGDDFWVDQLDITIRDQVLSDRWTSRDKHIIITDIRFENECTYVRSKLGKIVKIVRPLVNNKVQEIATESQKSHRSETEMKKIIPDWTVINQGSKKILGEELKLGIEALLKKK